MNEDLIKPFKLKQMLFGHAAYTFYLRNLKKKQIVNVLLS